MHYNYADDQIEVRGVWNSAALGEKGNIYRPSVGKPETKQCVWTAWTCRSRPCCLDYLDLQVKALLFGLLGLAGQGPVVWTAWTCRSRPCCLDCLDLQVKALLFGLLGLAGQGPVVFLKHAPNRPLLQMIFYYVYTVYFIVYNLLFIPTYVYIIYIKL